MSARVRAFCLMVTLSLSLMSVAVLALPLGDARSATISLPSFSASVAPVLARNLPFTWRAGCPVGPSSLRELRLRFYGFDGQSHLGTIIVNAGVVGAVIDVFRVLYQKHFPIRRMQPVDVFRGSDPASMAADNTSGFNCRYAVTTGPRQWSVHAYGEAIDVNPVENPYLEAGEVEPAAGAAFLNRADRRPGMAVPNGVLNAAFASIGWQWGGRWSASPDYQHFSSTGG